MKHWRWLSLMGMVVLFGCRAGREGSASPKVSPGEAVLSTKQMEDAQIKVAVAEVLPIEQTISAGARIAFDDLKVTHVFSPVTGRVTRILAHPGERVKKGAPLVAIASPDVGSVFSDLLKAEADLTATERDFRRQQELFKGHAGTQKDLETAEGNYRKARAESERAQQKARLLKTGSLDKVSQEYTLRAPIEGEVIARSVNLGMEVQGLYSGATPLELFTIGELDTVWLIADIYEMDIARVHKGDGIKVNVLAYPDQIFEGKVDWISGTLDPVMRTAKARCTLQNPERKLKPEMYGTVSISVSTEPALAVPRKAVLRLGEQTVVFVSLGGTADGGVRFARRSVVVNEQQPGALVAVLRGLNNGETVVVDGTILLAGMI